MLRKYENRGESEIPSKYTSFFKKSIHPELQNNNNIVLKLLISIICVLDVLKILIKMTVHNEPQYYLREMSPNSRLN